MKIKCNHRIKQTEPILQPPKFKILNEYFTITTKWLSASLVRYLIDVAISNNNFHILQYNHLK